MSKFSDDEAPELIVFFIRPESLTGLHQLAAFITNDPEVVASPWGAGCGSIAVWPLHYLSKNQNKAVIGGWDPSARKFFKTDELSFTVPFSMFENMLNRYRESFLSTKTWQSHEGNVNQFLTHFDNYIHTAAQFMEQNNPKESITQP